MERARGLECGRASTNRDVDLIGSSCVLANAEFPFKLESGMAFKHGAALHLLEPVLDTNPVSIRCSIFPSLNAQDSAQGSGSRHTEDGSSEIPRPCCR